MSKKTSPSPWRRIKKPRKPQGFMSTNIPIDRMTEFNDEQRASLPEIAKEAWAKENDLTQAQGPHSPGEPHYPKTLKAIPYPKDKK